MNCSPEKCISDVLVNDNILNCPPPKCSDESNCVNNEKPNVVSVKSGSSDSSSSAHIIVPIVVLVVAALICIVCFCKKKKPSTNSETRDEHVQELRPTTRSDLDSYLDFQDVRPVPVQQQHHYRPMPLVPEERDRPMPLVPPEQRSHERPMPSAPPSGFKDDPPPYDALFSTPSKRANV